MVGLITTGSRAESDKASKQYHTHQAPAHHEAQQVVPECLLLAVPERIHKHLVVPEEASMSTIQGVKPVFPLPRMCVYANP